MTEAKNFVNLPLEGTVDSGQPDIVKVFDLAPGSTAEANSIDTTHDCNGFRLFFASDGVSISEFGLGRDKIDDLVVRSANIKQGSK